MEKSIYDNDFTPDEIACLKKMIYKFRQEEILELYKKSTSPEEFMKSPYRITVSGCLSPPKRIIKEDVQFKSFLVKAKDAIVNFFRRTKTVSVEVINTREPNKNNNYYPPDLFTPGPASRVFFSKKDKTK